MQCYATCYDSGYDDANFIPSKAQLVCKATPTKPPAAISGPFLFCVYTTTTYVHIYFLSFPLIEVKRWSAIEGVGGEGTPHGRRHGPWRLGWPETLQPGDGAAAEANTGVAPPVVVESNMT